MKKTDSKIIKEGISPSLKGKTVAVSGSTGGIGGALCERLVRLGAHIICLDRNEKKFDRLASRLKTIDPSAEITYIQMDLENGESVRCAAEKLVQANIDILVLCAGAYHIPRKNTPCGIDNVFQINFVAPYYLATLMKPHIEKRGGRVVAVGSISQSFTKFDPKNTEKRKSADAIAYGNAKRCLAFALTRLFEGSDALSITHPGISPTGITAGYPAFIKAVIKLPMKLIFMPPKMAAESVVCGVLTSTPLGMWIGPRFLGAWGRPRLTSMRGYTAKEADVIVDEAKKFVKMLGGC